MYVLVVISLQVHYYFNVVLVDFTMSAGRLFLICGYIAQWLERLTADQQVPGSNPGVPFVAAAVTFCYSKFKAGFANIRPPGIEPGTI